MTDHTGRVQERTHDRDRQYYLYYSDSFDNPYLSSGVINRSDLFDNSYGTNIFHIKYHMSSENWYHFSCASNLVVTLDLSDIVILMVPLSERRHRLYENDPRRSARAQSYRNPPRFKRTLIVIKVKYKWARFQLKNLVFRAKFHVRLGALRRGTTAPRASWIWRALVGR